MRSCTAIARMSLMVVVVQLTELVERAQIAAIDLMFAELSVGDES